MDGVVGTPPVVRSRYPHMMAEDTGVWTRFLEAHAGTMEEVWYDVHVGTPVEVGPDADKVTRALAEGLTRKRIDVVARLQTGLWVVEVKPYCNMVAVGQVMTYVRAFIVRFAPTEEVWPVVVCDDWDDDVEGLCEELGVTIMANGGRELHNKPSSLLSIL